MISTILITTLLGLQDPVQLLTKAQIQQATLPAVTICQQIEQIGASHSPYGPPISISALFTDPQIRVGYESGEPISFLQLFGRGNGMPCLHISEEGRIIMLNRFFGLPPMKQPELPETQLKGYLTEAVNKCITIRNATSYQFEKFPAPYSTTQEKLADQDEAYYIVPTTNGVKWGPGGWGHGILINFTGEITFLKLGGSFTAIEQPASVLSENDAASYAAQVVLSKQEVGQTNVATSHGKFITGNLFIGDEYYQSNPRINAINNNNLGVPAYHFYMGDGTYSASGNPNLVYDIIIDAKTGHCLRMLNFATLGSPLLIEKIQPMFPSQPSLVQILENAKPILTKTATLVKTNSKPRGKLRKVIIKTGKTYTPAKCDSKYIIQIGTSLYALKFNGKSESR
jgi:hypothetical protein